MKSHRSRIQRIVLLLALILSAVTAYGGENERGTISGKVIDNVTKQPIPNAIVLVLGTKQGSATDAYGTFTIRGVEENIYKLRHSSLGYTTRVETEIRHQFGNDNHSRSIR